MKTKKRIQKRRERKKKEKTGCLGYYLIIGWIIGGIIWTYFGIRELIVQVDFRGLLLTVSGLFFIGFVIYKLMRMNKKK